MKIKGTKEWAKFNKNLQVGCEHGCLYCYAAYNEIHRFKRVKDYESWCKPELHFGWYEAAPKKLDGRIMFPTRHDITRYNLYHCVDYLKIWLTAGNEILITTKPDPECIRVLCKELRPWRKQIMFRFTITANNPMALRFWEPHAPEYPERAKALVKAYLLGYKTSISCEPILDATVINVVEELQDFVTDTIWLGKMNGATYRVDKSNWTKVEYWNLEVMEHNARDEVITFLYERYKDNPKIRWKDSIKEVIGLPDQVGVE